MHRSKGLEYDAVLLVDANEEITPLQKAILDEDLEEERRMFYVAMTRARKRLYIYWSKERYNKELQVSRFVGELYLSETELVVGSRITHKNYGTGTLEKVVEGKLYVSFDKLDKIRILDLNYCRQKQLLELKK